MNKANRESAKSPKRGVETLVVKPSAGVWTPDQGLCVLSTVHMDHVHAGVITIPDLAKIFNPAAGDPLLPVDIVPSMSPVSYHVYLP